MMSGDRRLVVFDAKDEVSTNQMVGLISNLFPLGGVRWLATDSWLPE